jgi:sugar phosphate isomerase/epimerase
VTRKRLSVHSVSFAGAPLAELDAHWQALGLTRLSLIAAQLDDPALPDLIARRGYRIESVTHLFAAGALPTGADGIATVRDDLMRTIAAAARLGARSIYMLTGGRGALSWEAAAALFSTTLAPCVSAAGQAGVALAIENASSLYVDIHLAHTLRDTITLAEMAGIGICIDHFHCWTEAGFDALVARALPRTQLIQLSDYVPGDRTLPARAVPGDGAIPIAPFVAQVLAAGYGHGFDLELLGPRIEAEGRFVAVMRACGVASAMLEELGA